jgi:signal recognition particle receptor subunit beta
MVVLNYTGGEINAKIVYYGPGVSGKTTNLEYIHEKAPQSAKGKMVSMKTQTDRTLFFDFLPLELGDINGYRTRFLLYTVPGQVYYNATRKLVLKGVDAVVFVADSSRAKLDENLESLKNLEQNLNEHGMTLDEIPWVIQYNKRDIPDAMTVADLDAKLNPLQVPTFEAVATLGTGVYETLHGISTKVYAVLKERLDREEAAGIATPEPVMETPAEVVPPPAPRPAPAAAAPKPAPAAPAPKPAPVAPAPPKPARAPEFETVFAGPGKPAATAPRTPEPEIEHEHEVDHAIDFALRESPGQRGGDAPARPEATRPAPPRPAAPKPAAPAAAAPRDAEPAVAERPAAKTAADGEDLFEAIPDSGFDADLGRLPSLDEASAASDSARDQGPEEFVTDPMRHVPRRDAAPKPAPAAPAPTSPILGRPAQKPAPAEKAAGAPRPAAAAKPAPAARPMSRSMVSIPIVEELHTTVYISRAQLERSSSIRVVVDVEVEDDSDSDHD